jgi:streptogramin lyase
MFRLPGRLSQCRRTPKARRCQPLLERLEQRALPSGGLTEFSLPTPGSGPVGITLGPDGNLWFTENATNQIGRLTPTGSLREFPLLTSGADPWGITAGPDGSLWFTEFFGNKIGRLTTAGSLTELPLPTANANPQGITAGPDGNLWFAEAQGNKIGRITPAGTLSEFALPPGSRPVSIAVGPDGNLRFTESQRNRIGQMTVAGTLTGEFPLPAAGSNPDSIVAGPDGNLWFTEPGSNRIGRLSTGGSLAEFPLPSPASDPEGIAAGPDGNVWFTESAGNRVGWLTPGGSLAEFAGLAPGSAPQGIAAGPGGTLWLCEQDRNQIAELVPDQPLSATGTSLLATATTSFRGTVASFTDADPTGTAADYTAMIAWGDGQQSPGTITPAGNGAFAVSVSHVYLAAGRYALTVTVTDQANRQDIGGSTATAQTMATVLPMQIAIQGPAQGLTRRPLTFVGLWDTQGSADALTATWRLTRKGRKGKVLARGEGRQLRVQLNTEGLYLLSLTVTDPDTDLGTTVSQVIQLHRRPAKH